jgi:hypothetical protein
MKPLAIALSVVGRGLLGGAGEGALTNVQYKAVQTCHNEFPCTMNISLIKMGEKEEKNIHDKKDAISH